MQSVRRSEGQCFSLPEGRPFQKTRPAHSALHVLQNASIGSILFQPGDVRRLYHVESGALCHYMHWSDGRLEIIEFAFPGDIIGLGKLSHGLSTAKATVATVVTIIAEPDLERMLLADHQLSLRHSIAGEREFDYLRDKAINTRKRSPVERVASYLVVVANVNLTEGRDAMLVPNEICSGFVAERLQMSVDTLTIALLNLQKKGLIAATTGGLRITNFTELESFADAA